MRITFLLETAYALFGSIQATLTTASALASRGHDVDIVSVFRDRAIPRHQLDPAVPVVSLIDLRPPGPGAGPEPAADPLAEELAQSPSAFMPGDQPLRAPYSRLTDRILAEYLAASPAEVIISAWPALHYHLAELAPPSIGTVAHDHLLYDYYPPSVQPLLRKAYAKLDRVVAVSAAAAETYRRQLPELAAKIHHIPNALPSLGLPASTGEARLVLAAGRLTRQKRFDLLIEAFAEVAREHPDWRLRIYGDGPEREKLRALIQRLRLYDHVFLMGVASPMAAEWVKGSIGALASEAESFGLVIAEAMQAGLPMISTDCPVGPREIIDHGVDGLLVPTGDVPAIAAAIVRLIESPAQRRAMAASAAKKADRFSAGRIAALHEELYSSLLQGKARTSRRRAAVPSPVHRGPAVTCTSRSPAELELVVEGAGGADEALLIQTRSGETLRIARSGMAGDAARFRIAVDDLPPGATGTWSLTVAGRAPHLKFIDNRRLVAELEARSGGAEALLPVEHDGVLKIHVLAEPRRAQLTGVCWAGEVLCLAGVLLGDGWCDMRVQIDAAGDPRRLTVACDSSGESFRCHVDTASAYALLGEGDGRWRVWLADSAEPARRVRIGRIVSDLRDPGAVVMMPGATLAGEAVQIHPRLSRTGLLTLELTREGARALSTDTVSIPAETDSAGGGQI
ncbi:MAG TPA: glycosyltransferase [Thermoanaerobaculia bacterium]